ncbi:MAG: MOSC domain-containing protein [Phenylobacterium sp.]
MSAYVAALYHHPIKGFTPQLVRSAKLVEGQPFPADRLWAIENGPSGFDPAAPAFVPKQKFTVLASIPEVARALTAYDAETTRLTASAAGLPSFTGRLAEPADRTAFADWVTQLIGDHARGPLQVLPAPTEHRFTDHPKGHVSIINLASVRDLATRLGQEVDFTRFRANLYVEGWPAWVENEWTGQRLTVGGAAVEVFKPIVRCAATAVNPATAARDLDIVRALYDNYGHMHCGIYVHVVRDGHVAPGDACSQPQEDACP